ncbi:DnrP protein [Pseudoalteromonas sp. C2R02]|uniref:DnrP protein n=1 Tax=Pseudoalteromonas sp. C2R02 TaxID=2841565 RepID=UPI001C09B624|nr:DnrP protein [Pseudoalteromonas sp. C2R02]MBU2970493.1 DnrP protein [Pseudoalteromonas sp. C2R02]
MIETIHCLYCDTENTLEQEDKYSSSQETICCHCGMILPQCHPHSATYRRRIFKYAFWPIFIFCIVMMIYLPR